MLLQKLPDEKQLLEIALRRARKASARVSLRNKGKQLKKREIMRIDVAAAYIAEALEKTVKGFPSIDKSPAFEREMIESVVDTNSLKKALGQLSAGARLVRKIKTRHLVAVKKLGRERSKEAKGESKSFIGRTASVLESMGKSIAVYNSAAEKLRELPAIKELPTVIIAGYPNVGKSTLLKRLTGSKVKIAAYAFTTKRLELGYFKHGYGKIQVIDTPGLLDSPLGEMNKIEKKGISALKHLASLIVFVLDPTQESGFPLEKQLGLMKAIGKEFGKAKMAVYLSKKDVASSGEMEKARQGIKGMKEIKADSEEVAGLL